MSWWLGDWAGCCWRPVPGPQPEDAALLLDHSPLCTPLSPAGPHAAAALVAWLVGYNSALSGPIGSQAATGRMVWRWRARSLQTALLRAGQRAEAADKRADEAVDAWLAQDELRAQLVEAERRVEEAERRADEAVDALLEDDAATELERRLAEAEARAEAAERRAQEAVDMVMGDSAEALDARLREAEERAMEATADAEAWVASPPDAATRVATRRREGSGPAEWNEGQAVLTETVTMEYAGGEGRRISFASEPEVHEIEDKETLRQMMLEETEVLVPEEDDDDLY